MIPHLLRYSRTVRSLQPRQIAWRVRFLARRALGRMAGARMPDSPPRFDHPALQRLRDYMLSWSRHETGLQQSAKQIRGGELRTFNARIATGHDLRWDACESFPNPGRVALHGFDFARTLALGNLVSPDPRDVPLAKRWFHGWIEQHPPSPGVPWHPFQVASRLLNWAMTAAVLDVADSSVRGSYAQQAGFLLRNLEYDILANHLYRDATALVVAGSLLGQETDLGRQALERGRSLLMEQLPEQILADGGHYERSVMYHCQVLSDSLSAWAALESKPEALTRSIESMACFLARMVLPDGQIPLFGDAALNAGVSPLPLIAVASELCGFKQATVPRGCYSLDASGFHVLVTSDGAARMVVKTAQPAPAYQLAHAHSDMLSYELSVGPRRIIVDSGVYDYEPNAFREYCRSTRAHNTVRVAGRDQLECWGVFRVGRRYRSTLHEWGQVEGDSAPTGGPADVWRLCASHDGFRRYDHRRVIAMLDGRCWIVADTVSGRGRFEAESYIHFHPDVTLAKQGGIWIAHAGPSESLGDAQIQIVPFDVDSAECVHGERRPLQGWYCPEFGVCLPATCLVLRKRARKTARFGYALFPAGTPPLAGEALASQLAKVLPQA